MDSNIHEGSKGSEEFCPAPNGGMPRLPPPPVLRRDKTALSAWTKTPTVGEHLADGMADVNGQTDFQFGVFPSLPLLPSVKSSGSPTNSVEHQVQVFAMSR